MILAARPIYQSSFLATVLLLIVNSGPSFSQGQYGLSQQPQILQPQRPFQQPPPPPPPPPSQQQQGPTLIRSPCPRAIKINTNDRFRGMLHFICLQATGGRPRLEVIQYNNQKVILTMDVNEPDVDQLASFVDESGALRILLAVPNRLNGTSMYSIDRMGQVIEETHTINTQYVSTLSIWKMELNDEWQLAIANQPSYAFNIPETNQIQSMPDPKPMISLLSWRSTYFDSYQLITLPEDGRVNKLEPMHINGQEFLIVAIEPHRVADQSLQEAGLQPIGANSLIYKLDFGDGFLKWIHYQNLYTQIAFDVKSFAITHKNSLQRDYYVAVVGQAKSDLIEMTSYNNNRAPNVTTNPFYGADNYEHPYGLIIYKYFGDQFRRTEHTLPAPGAIKLDTITYAAGDSYVIIALLTGGSNHVNLYLFDGLVLKLMPGPFGRPPPPPPTNTYPYTRQRRTMENSANLHLFMVPPTPNSDIKGSNYTSTQQKRTITDESVQTLKMPALALSTVDMPQYENINNYNRTNSEAESVYHIPINDMIKEELEQQQLKDGSQNSGYSKRNYVGISENLLGWCKAKIGELLSDNFNSLAQTLLALPRIDQSRPIELVGNLFVEDDLHVSNLLYARQIEERIDRQQRLVIETPQFLNSLTFEKIQQAHREIQAIEQQVNRILVDDGTEQIVYSPLIFDHLIVDCLAPANFDPRFLHTARMSGSACPYIDEIHTTRLNWRNISNIRQQALLTGRPMEIKGDVRFEHLVLRGHVAIMDSLNGIHINDIVFKRGASSGPIVGHKTFMNGLFSSSRLAIANWDGKVVDRNNYLTSSEFQRVETNLRFSQVVLDSPIGLGANMSSRIEKLNGIHLDTHLGQIAIADDNNNFEAPLYFDELILNGPVKLTDSSPLCQIDVENLYLNTMFKQSNQNITAPMHFTGDVHIAYGGDIRVDGLINGVPFQPEAILMRDMDYTFTNPVIFDSDVSVRDLILDKALNGIQVIFNPETRLHELAILYNGGTQQITGNKVFDEVYLGGETIIRGSINGHLNISELYKMANMNGGEPHRFSEVHLTGPNLYRVANGVDIVIANSINGISANSICDLANRISQTPYLEHKRLKFDQPIRFKSLRCASINGFTNLTRSFLTRGGNQFVAGTLKLTNGAIFNSSINIRSTLNNIRVAPLAAAIARTVNETRSGHKDVRGDLIVDELFVDRINDFNLANVFLSRSDEPQFVRAPMIFDHLDIENVLIIGKNLITNSFNNLNVTDILTNTLQYDTPQVIYNHVELGTLQLLANTSFLTKSFNGYDLQRLYADSVLKDVPQQILAPKIFRAPVEFSDRVQLRHGIDELTADDLRFNLLLHGDEVIEGDVEFMNDVIIKKELEIQSGMINDIDINLFVDSMLYEKRPDKSMRVVNGSVRFKDVKVNNLVVGGKIQGIDLSREALLKNETSNGAYDARIREQQALINNQRLLNSHYGPGSSFQVQSKYRGLDHSGTCYVHSCSPRNVITLPMPQPQQAQMATTPMYPQEKLRSQIIYQNMTQPQVQYIQQPQYIQPQAQYTQDFQFGNLLQPQLEYMPQPQAQYIPQPPPPPPKVQYIQQSDVPLMRAPIKYVQQFYPNILPPRPLVLSNNSLPTMQQQAIWQPKWELVVDRPQQINYTIAHKYEPQEITTQLIDPKYLEHKSMLQAQAISDLTYRINRYLSVSFYYEIAHKHPLLGPLLHAASNPILDEQGSPLLLLKGTSKKGEPFLQSGQTIAIMVQKKHQSLFALNSLILETSNPIKVDSVIVEQTKNYLFILDSYLDERADMTSQVIVYFWSQKSGRYEIKQKLVLDGYPTAMKAFTLGQIACVTLAFPKMVTNSSVTGAPLVFCQTSPLSLFNRRFNLPVQNVFDLDVVTLPRSSQFIVASLSQQQDTEQIGDLSVGTFDMATMRWDYIVLRKMVRPMKLHLFHDIVRPLVIKIAVSEAITSNDDTQALTRIFALRIKPGFGTSRLHLNTSIFQEIQIFRDNQFYDIQSVHLDNMHSMLFFQSAHSISIYAPTNVDNINYNSMNDCDDQYSLVQRLPTKGFNKFLVFNSHMRDTYNNYTNNSGPFDHFLVLSKEDCEKQHYATVILKAKFR